MRLTSDTDPDAVRAHLEAEDGGLRVSEARADRLQRDARIRSGRWDLEVGIETGHPPATVSGGAGATPFRITLSGDPVPQPVTAYAQPEWDLLVQRVRLLHEIAHLDYSDPGDLQDRLASVPQGYRPVARALWNAFEDGAIEGAIRDRWPNYGDWFREVRRNTLLAIGPGIQDPRGGLIYPMAQAAVLAVLDGTVIGAGPLARLLDPDAPDHRFHTAADRERFEATVLPAIDSAKAQLQTAQDAADRNRIAIDCADSIRPAIEAARADGRAQVAAWSGNFWGMPDDAIADWETDSPKAVPPAEHRLESGTPLEGGNARSEARDTVAAGNSDEDDDTRADVDPAPEETDQDDPASMLAEDIAAEIAAQRRQGDGVDERSETLETLQAAVSAAETELESDGILIPDDDPTPHEPTQNAAKADGTRLARVLRNRFQKERKRSIERNRRRGRLDPAALHRSATGSRRVKQRRERPDETEYRCLFVLDRSGSMRQHVRVAEQAMGMLAVALEAVDVDVSVLELLDKEVRLAKPVDRTVDRAAGRLYHGDVGGGTPLTDTLHIAREYLKRATGTRFVIVVTDGRPAEPDLYREALNRFTVPVLGVNLTTEEAAGESEFHRQVTVPPSTERLRRALRQLVQEVLFE